MRRRKIENAAPKGWDVVVVPASRMARAYYYDYEERNPVLVHGEMSVRLTYNGKERMTFGIVKLKDEQFEDKLLTMKAAAQERASALEAAGATG